MLRSRSPSRSRSRAAPRAALIFLLACTADLGPDAVTQCDRSISIPAAPLTDVLFVIDDSNSMQEEQENLAANFEKFVSALKGAGVKHEFQVGVTTTSVLLRYFAGAGDVTEIDSYDTSTDRCSDPQGLAGKPYAKGALLAAPGRPRILRFDSPTIVADFQANVKVGTCGSGQEQGLEAVRLAVQKAVAGGVNAGFLRSGARLAVIVVTDEDDCSDPERRVALGLDASTDWCAAQSGSLGKVEDYVSFLYGLGREVFFAAIAPVNVTTRQPEKCGTAFGVGRRYVEAARAFAGNGLVESICSQDFGPALVAIAGLLEAPSTFRLPEPPADPGLLDVSLIHAGGAEVPCPLGSALSYQPPGGGAPATVTVSGPCKPRGGDRLEVHLLCAG